MSEGDTPRFELLTTYVVVILGCSQGGPQFRPPKNLFSKIKNIFKYSMVGFGSSVARVSFTRDQIKTLCPHE